MAIYMYLRYVEKIICDQFFFPDFVSFMVMIQEKPYLYSLFMVNKMAQIVTLYVIALLFLLCKAVTQNLITVAYKTETLPRLCRLVYQIKMK